MTMTPKEEPKIITTEKDCQQSPHKRSEVLNTEPDKRSEKEKSAFSSKKKSLTHDELMS
jgi:hypothetical protein